MTERQIRNLVLVASGVLIQLVILLMLIGSGSPTAFMIPGIIVLVFGVAALLQLLQPDRTSRQQNHLANRVHDRLLWTGLALIFLGELAVLGADRSPDRMLFGVPMAVLISMPLVGFAIVVVLRIAQAVKHQQRSRAGRQG